MKGCILIHGFTGSPYEVQPLADHLKKRTDWNIYKPTLAGHGEGESLKSTTWKDWLQSAETALVRVLEENEVVYVVGFSMGGMIAGHLATKYPIDKLVLLSPALYSPHPQNMIKEFTEMTKRMLKDEPGVQQYFQKYKNKWTQTPLKAVLNFKKLVRELKPSLNEIKVPILIVHGERDHVVHPKSSQHIYEQVQSLEKELFFLPESKHIVCHDCEQEMLFNKIEQFLQVQDNQHAS